jgi:hypothetical protein
MTISSQIVVVGCVLGAISGCYSDPINSRPDQPEIIVPPNLPRNLPSTFTALASDPDGDRLSFEWTSGPGMCDSTTRPVSNINYSTSYKIMLTPDPTGKACVWLVVTDPYGASNFVPKTVMVNNGRPSARITVQQPDRDNFGHYDLFSTFRLSAGDSSDPDGDSLTRRWKLFFPDNYSGDGLRPCLGAPADAADLVQCLGPVAEPGMYEVELVVNDGNDDSTPVRVPLVVNDDAPPCITQTAPQDPMALLVWDPARDKSFEVQNVKDDGDPYPAPIVDVPPRGTATFNWSLRRNSGAWQALDGYDRLASVTIAGGNFLIGDRVQVRVEVSDRIVAHKRLGCDDKMDLCPAACPLRVTWTVDYR